MYKQKLDGASPDEASRKIKSLEEKINRLTSMDIGDDKVKEILRYLDGEPSVVSIDTDMLSSFGSHLAEQLDDIFNQAGWKVYRSKSMHDGDRVREVVLHSAAVGAGSKDADRVETALRLGGIPFRVELSQDEVDRSPTISFRA